MQSTENKITLKIQSLPLKVPWVAGRPEIMPSDDLAMDREDEDRWLGRDSIAMALELTLENTFPGRGEGRQKEKSV